MTNNLTQSRIFKIFRVVVPRLEAASLARVHVLKANAVVACTAVLLVQVRQGETKTLGSMAADRQ